ncbi:hypothetical protein [Bacillus mycoides]|uniref:hypothetical protein n=1 Tax=Bacillus mycoides TaxID=1405 RepID=UPI0024AE7263|nr:hypothetical protein [Bacillus mycoides]MDI6535165.1 hypothetical protein [Bacillus mycoides]
MLNRLIEDIGYLNGKRKEFRRNTVDHMAAASYDAMRYSFKTIGTVAVALLFTVLNKWQ